MIAQFDSVYNDRPIYVIASNVLYFTAANPQVHKGATTIYFGPDPDPVEATGGATVIVNHEPAEVASRLSAALAKAVSMNGGGIVDNG
jgi:hypothetical protein